MIRFKESVDPPTLFILDSTGQNTSHIRQQLVKYKKRWGSSLANNLAIIHVIEEATAGSTIIVPQYVLNTLPSSKPIAKYETVPSINAMTHYDLRAATLVPNVKYTKDIIEAQQWLDSLSYIAAFDTESTGLSVQSDEITMFSFASNETDAFVISNESQEMQDMVLNYLTNSKHHWIIHNSSYDLKLVYYYTKKFPKYFDDTQLMWWTVLNHADTFRAKVGLKGLAKDVYKDYAVSADLFGIEHKYNPELIKYSGLDAVATMYIYNEVLQHADFKGNPKKVVFKDLLPIEDPKIKNTRQSSKYFYQNVALPLVKPMIKLMLNGIQLDPVRVDKLDNTLQEVLLKVQKNLALNPIIRKFQAHNYKKLKRSYIQEKEEKKRSLKYYLKPFKQGDMIHRSYLMNELSLTYTFKYVPEDKLPTGIPKWSVKDIKRLIGTANSPIFVKLLTNIINKVISEDNSTVLAAMRTLAIDKTTIYNQKYIEAIENVTEDTILHPFNPGSSKQKSELFEFLDIPCEAFSKDTGLPSWNRAQIERVNKETQNSDIKSFTQDFIDHSFSAIVKTNFIEGFRKFSINNRLFGNYRIAGAKSFRCTSNSINMLNMPSTGSIYSIPIKECLIAKPGFIIIGSDFSALTQ